MVLLIRSVKKMKNAADENIDADKCDVDKKCE